MPEASEGDHSSCFKARIVRDFRIPFQQKYPDRHDGDDMLRSRTASISEKKPGICAQLPIDFRRQLNLRIVWSYAGVRPLFDDAAKNAPR